MGVITLALVTATATGSFNQLPDMFSFLRMEKSQLAEESIKLGIDAKATPSALDGAADTLAAESEKLKPGEFREAFEALAARFYQEVGRTDDGERMKSAAAATHALLLAREDARILTKVPVLGGMVAAKHNDWNKVLDKEMKSAAAAGKKPLAAAAGKVRDLSPDVPAWIKVVCALTMAAGTAAGGWRIIKTLGHKMVKLQPVHGFAAETTAATLLAVTGNLGMTVSTTHSITTAIMGVGCAKRFNALKFSLIERIIWAWILTLPAAGIVAYLAVKTFQWCGWLP
jgi:phosphate/sulfate permease